jgi:hypothetical protein
MAYATPEQLASQLRVRVTGDILTRLQDCLDAAAQEIDTVVVVPEGDPPPIVVMVNISRATEWWRDADVAFGVLGLDTTGAGVRAPRDPFARHTNSLMSAGLVTKPRGIA